MVPRVKATVRGLGIVKKYVDGTEPMEIWIPSGQANGLPYMYGSRIPINLKINSKHYHAGLRATINNPYIWICPDVKNNDGVGEKLVYILTDAGFKKNDKVVLIVDGNNIELKADIG